LYAAHPDVRRLRPVTRSEIGLVIRVPQPQTRRIAHVADVTAELQQATPGSVLLALRGKSMFKRLAFFGGILALTLSLAFVGCSDDSTGPGDSGPPPEDFSGNWNMSGEVIARTVCDNEIGDTREWDVVITQEGDKATISLNGGPQTVLTVVGNSAEGSKTEGEMLDFALTINGGEIVGTITANNPQVPCEEIWTVTAVRTNDSPSPDFAGNWDLELEVVASTCESEPVGASETICRVIEVNGNTVSILDEDGLLSGVGDGDTVVVMRETVDESLQITLTVNGDAITGTVLSRDLDADCQTTLSVVGARRSESCPPPAEPGDFAGFWTINVQVSTSECPDEQPGDQFTECMTVSVEGTTIILDDGSFEGPIVGEIEGDRAELSRTGDNGTLTVRLELDGDDIYGEATMEYFAGSCPEATVVYALQGARRSTPCGEGSGPFNGYWNVTGSFTKNECQFEINNTCSEFIQDGDYVYIVGDEVGGVADGNLLRMEDVFEFEGTRFSIVLEIELANDGDSWTGIQTVSLQDLQNPEIGCESIANIDGVRTAACRPEELRRIGMDPGASPVRARHPGWAN
jgi:hypothetical protein